MPEDKYVYKFNGGHDGSGTVNRGHDDNHDATDDGATGIVASIRRPRATVGCRQQKAVKTTHARQVSATR